MYIDNTSISNLYISGALVSSGSLIYGNTYAQNIVGNLQGTASYANTTLTSSYISSSGVVGIIPSASNSTNSGLLFSTINFTTSSTDTYVGLYRSLGSKAQLKVLGGYDPSSTDSFIVGFDSARPSVMPVYIYNPITISGVMWWQQRQGNYTTTTQYNGVALYSYDSAGTLNLLLSSSNNPNIWKAPTDTWASQSFDTPYTISTEGIYYIAIIHNFQTSTTSPSLGRMNPAVSAAATYLRPFKATNSAVLHGATTSTATTFPTTIAMSTLGILAVRTYLILY
jgi:hypothetical protein